MSRISIAEEKRYFWRTANPYLKKIESELLDSIFRPLAGGNILEVGCGTGANFFFLKKYFSDLTGVDPSEKSLSIGRQQVKEAKFFSGRAQVLPFPDESFDVIFMRDVLHHISDIQDKRLSLREMKRVCRKGGQIILIEPNYRNIIIFFQWLLRPEEKGLKDSRADWLKRWFEEENFSRIEISQAEPLPLDRLILHFRTGWPALSRFFLFRKSLSFINSIYKLLIPRKFWAYLILKTEK
ncbi:MAG: class I SAM-dependent methyltransferase [Patescibacteria group bacterium]